MEFNHIPVLLNECIEKLNIDPNGIYVDCTVGGAGHSLEIVSRLSSNGRLICIDRDICAVKVASERLSQFGNAIVMHSNYSEIDFVLSELGIDAVDGVLMDLGVSSYQLDEASRGFSYHSIDAPLDMRMNQIGMSAADIINSFSEQQLSNIILKYGEEKFAHRIATNIVRARNKKPLLTTKQLADIIKESVPQKVRRRKNPCKKTFQAIRIAVNNELDHLSKGLDKAFAMLKSHGRLAIITFHSLEDRIVKQRFSKWCNRCICQPDFPKCVCRRQSMGMLVNRKPIKTCLTELKLNNRSKNAKLRVIEKSISLDF